MRLSLQFILLEMISFVIKQETPDLQLHPKLLPDRSSSYDGGLLKKNIFINYTILSFQEETHFVSYHIANQNKLRNKYIFICQELCVIDFGEDMAYWKVTKYFLQIYLFF